MHAITPNRSARLTSDFVTPSHDGVCAENKIVHGSRHKAGMTSLTNAFSLVELSIVLVILGLLVGGVLSGQALIRAAELRSVNAEYSRYVAAVHSFRDKYFGLPGDITNATTFWNAADANPATCITTPSTDARTCNGNGDGQVARDYETWRAWQQLANAGLIEGSFNGVQGSLGAYDHVRGVNAPASKISNTTWGFYYMNHAGDGAHYRWNYENTFAIGAETSAQGAPEEAFLKPEEAWNIDTKFDDGRPGTGKVFALNGGGAGFNNVVSCTTSTSNTDYTGSYRLNQNNVRCSLYLGM
jgi:prepilin-type N-terminal cleavage/methylation domain-containing protein